MNARQVREIQNMYLPRALDLMESQEMTLLDGELVMVSATSCELWILSLGASVSLVVCIARAACVCVAEAVCVREGVIFPKFSVRTLWFRAVRRTRKTLVVWCGDTWCTIAWRLTGTKIFKS